MDVTDALEDLRRPAPGRAHRGLVQQQELGRRDQAPADCEHLLLASGERAGILARPLAQDGEELHRVLDIAGGVGAGAQRRRAELQVLAHGHAGEHLPVFRHVRDAEMRPLSGRNGGEVLPLEQDASAATGTVPEIALNSVLLPAPFGPMTVTNSPARTVRSMPVKAARPP